MFYVLVQRVKGPGNQGKYIVDIFNHRALTGKAVKTRMRFVLSWWTAFKKKINIFVFACYLTVNGPKDHGKIKERGPYETAWHPQVQQQPVSNCYYPLYT